MVSTCSWSWYMKVCTYPSAASLAVAESDQHIPLVFAAPFVVETGSNSLGRLLQVQLKVGACKPSLAQL